MAKKSKSTKSKKNNKLPIKVFILVAILAAVGWGVYSYLQVKKQGGLNKPVVTCLNDGSCVLTAHIHSYMVIEMCGEPQYLGNEVGPLDGPHTHEERNIIHWHDKLPYDKEKEEITDTTKLKVGTAMDNQNLTFDSTSLMDRKNGEGCPNGKPGSLKMFVKKKGENSFKQNEDYREYIWEDQDIIVIVFDERTAQETKEYLNSQNIEFPKLGRG
ncbi:hypothetical protein DYH10_01395 [Candidatus Saccharibacteria bacterium CPR2]|nr:hypothetical protein [Candidatus Saccharibacteria bacterium CPR2]